MLKTVISCLIALQLPSIGAAQPSGQRYSPEEYIAEWKEVALMKMREHGIPASITLAQGLLESGNGNSELARKGNNHFGIKCTPDWKGGRTYHDDDKKDDCFRKYRDASESYEDHAAFLQKPRYAALFQLEPTDYKGWAHGLKKAGYATDPNYPGKLIALIERYDLHRLDRGVDVVYKPKEPSHTGRPSQRPSASQGEVLTYGAGRAIEEFEGRIKYVTVKEGDDLRRIARDLEMTHGMLARWNDLDKEAKLVVGSRLYIQPKRNTARSIDHHVAKAGETLWDVSYERGVKLKRLAKYNGLPENAALDPGQVVKLRR